MGDTFDNVVLAAGQTEKPSYKVDDTFDGITLAAGTTETADLYAEGDTFDGITLCCESEEKTGYYQVGDTFDGVVLGANEIEGSNNIINVDFGDLDAHISTLACTDTLTFSAAQAAITALDESISNVSQQRASFGAATNRLTHASDSISAVKTATAASRSRILDTDYAIATSNLARAQIIQQAATSMLAQANQSSQLVMSLINS